MKWAKCDDGCNNDHKAWNELSRNRPSIRKAMSLYSIRIIQQTEEKWLITYYTNI